MAYAGLSRGRDKLILEQAVNAFEDWRVLVNELNIPAVLKQYAERTFETKMVAIIGPSKPFLGDVHRGCFE